MSTTSGTRAAAKGLFITFEGPDGSGKSTQARRLVERLRGEGREVLQSVEPGGTPIGQQIRRILLDPANKELAPTAELLLMFAARAQNVEQWIRPALAQGKIVVSDRFTDSSIAYQGSGRGLGWDKVLELDRIACQGLAPDLTLCIDIDTQTGLSRALSRGSNAAAAPELRFEEQTIEFHHKVREAYHELARRQPQRFRLIDGSGSPDEVAAKVWEHVAPLLVT
jgi:dTMP kinase